MDVHDNAMDYEMHDDNKEEVGVKGGEGEGLLSESECSSAVPAIVKVSETVNKVDRQRMCPMYVRIFCRMNGHHNANEFGPKRQPIDDEVVVYTWKDATLSELADLIKEVNEDCRSKNASFDFQLVYVDLKGRFMFKPMGRVSNSRPTRDAQLTLESVRFRQGDFIDVAIYLGPMPASTTTSGGDSYNYPKRPRYAPVRRNR